MNSSTKEEIIQKADQLFYEKGFDHTSFADISKAVDISRGNFYHHFKTKNDILVAVIGYRLEKTKMMLKDWDSQTNNPVKKIESFIKILLTNIEKIEKFGCPVGTLTNELSKLDHPCQCDANQIFELFRIWLEEQFKAMGMKQNSNKYAMHLLSQSQGVATMLNTYQDPNFVKQEVKFMVEWVKSLEKMVKNGKGK